MDVNAHSLSKYFQYLMLSCTDFVHTILLYICRCNKALYPKCFNFQQLFSSFHSRFQVLRLCHTNKNTNLLLVLPSSQKVKHSSNQFFLSQKVLSLFSILVVVSPVVGDVLDFEGGRLDDLAQLLLLVLVVQPLVDPLQEVLVSLAKVVAVPEIKSPM